MTETNKELALESWVSFKDAQQADTRALLRRFDRHRVVFDHYTLESVLRTSEVLEQFRIYHQGRLIYSGRGLVRSLINSGPTTVCEAALEDSWVDLQAVTGNNGGSLLERYRDFFETHQQLHFLDPDYTAAVAGLRNYLSDVRLWLDHTTLSLGTAGGPARDRQERDTAEAIHEPIVRTIGDLFDRYETVAQKVPENLVAAYYAYGQRQVRTLLLDAPFVFRTFRKPLGYAGDYMMVAMMFRDPFEGPSLFARVLNQYSLSLPPIVAHRNRIAYLVQQLEQETLRVLRRNGRLRAYNLGCGPAREVQRLIAESPAADHLDLTLVDFNQETLDHARDLLQEACAQNHRRTGLHFVKKSVQQVLKESVRSRGPGQLTQYDVVYCAGLFDYLSDNVCTNLVELFWRMTAPGGLLIVTNVDRHPSRAQMECYLEWNLVYRGTCEMQRLVPTGVSPDDVALKRDSTGVNIFLEIRKPEDVH